MMSLEKKKKTRLFIEVGGVETGLAFKPQRFEVGVALFFGRKRSRRGHQKRGTDDLWFGERIDCSREPWKRRTECVVRFPTLFPFISLSKSHFSLCAKMRSDLLPSLGLARLPHGVFLQFGRSARFRQLKRIYIYTYTTSSALW